MELVPNALKDLFVSVLAKGKRFQFTRASTAALTPRNLEVLLDDLRGMSASEICALTARRDCRPIGLMQHAVFVQNGLRCGFTYGVTIVNKESRDVHWCVWVEFEGIEYLVDRLQEQTLRLLDCERPGKDYMQAERGSYFYVFAKSADDALISWQLGLFWMDCAISHVRFLIGTGGVAEVQPANVECATVMNDVLRLCSAIYPKHPWKARCKTLELTEPFGDYRFHLDFSTDWTSAKETPAMQKDTIDAMRKGEVTLLNLFISTWQLYFRGCK
jgi:hypothetical protein